MMMQHDIGQPKEKNTEQQLMVLKNMKNFYKDQNNQHFIFTKA